MYFFNRFSNHVNASIEVKSKLLETEFITNVEKIVRTHIDVLEAGNKLLFAGNGGSAADAQHLATEYVSKLKFNRPALAAISLATDTSAITAIGNDYGFERLFERQLQAIAREGDLFIGLTTSGNSQNLVKAFEYCKLNGIKTVAFLGNDGGQCLGLSQQAMLVPSENTAHIQEAHIMLGHVICAAVEGHFFFNEKS